jgi:hypothetical protein
MLRQQHELNQLMGENEGLATVVTMANQRLGPGAHYKEREGDGGKESGNGNGNLKPVDLDLDLVQVQTLLGLGLGGEPSHWMDSQNQKNNVLLSIHPVPDVDAESEEGRQTLVASSSVGHNVNEVVELDSQLVRLPSYRTTHD